MSRNSAAAASRGMDIATHRQVRLDELRHASLDRRQVLLAEAALEGEVVIEAVLDHRPDGDLRRRVELLDRVGEQVGGRVADDLQALGRRAR